MRVDIVMPHMGQSMEEGRVIRWLKPVGASVARGEAIAEIETDKAVMDLESTASGTLREWHVAEGETAATGSVLAVIDDGQVAQSAAPTSAGAEASASPSGDRIPEGAPPVVAGSPPVRSASTRDQASPSVTSSPLARTLAAAAGIELSDVPGSGPNGRIVKEDVEAWLASKSGADDVASSPRPAPADIEPMERSKIQLATARLMTTSKRTAPHFYVSSEIRMDAALAYRGSGTGAEAGISVNALILKAAAASLGAFPHLNATILDDELRLHRRIDLSIAVAVADGLVAPVVRDCATMSLVTLAAAARQAIDRAREGRLSREDIEGGTFTVSNLGMYGVSQFGAIINPPQVAILAVGEVRRVAGFDDDDRVVPMHVLTATVSADHRATDGAEVARFLQAFREAMADPENNAR